MQQQFELEITSRGYLILPVEIAAKYYPEDACVAMIREDELWVLPIRSAAAGGLMLKQRNLEGDRSVLVWEALPDDHQSGNFPATWDPENGAMRIDFQEPV
jgi:hypothetical protein